MNSISRIIFATLIIISTSTIVHASPKPIVEIDTSMGKIIVELNHRRAPGTVKNFLKYVKSGTFDETIFHRVIAGFMIQGGGFDLEGNRKPTLGPIKNESNNGLYNRTGTIAMARTDDVNSATNQFFINVNNNKSLNAKFKQLGYTVFGKVIEGMDVVMDIADVEVAPKPLLGENVPLTQVIIKSIKLLEPVKKIKAK